ncbi:MAG: CBU_0592 family membrane protein [Rufibacter sp.]
MLSLRKYLQEAIGWAGALFSLTAFSLNSLNVLSSQSLVYLFLNVIGCFLLILYAIHKKAHASWVLNSIWLLMTAVAIAKVCL